MFEDLLGALPEEEKGADIEDRDFLAGLGIPKDEPDDAYGWDGWTAGTVRKGLAELAYSIGIAPERLLAKALKKRRDIQEQNTDAVQRLEAILKLLRRRMKVKDDRLKRERMLPETNTRQKITRYEAHLSQQLLQARPEQLMADRRFRCQRLSMWWSTGRLEKTLTRSLKRRRAIWTDESEFVL